MTALVWTAPAIEDLRSIDRWLRREATRDFAVRTLAEIKIRARFLCDFPHGGRPMPNRDFRILRVPHTPYLILYRLKNNDAELLRVRHEREDWQVEV